MPILSYSIAESMLIVLAMVRQTLPARWTTPDGSRPANPHDGRHTIFRPVLVAVERYLKGQAGEPQLYLWADGGKIGQDEVFYSGTFSPPPAGTRVVLFLRANRQRTVQVNTVIPLSVLDYYLISADGRASNRAQDVPLQRLLDQIAAAVAAAAATPDP